MRDVTLTLHKYLIINSKGVKINMYKMGLKLYDFIRIIRQVHALSLVTGILPRETLTIRQFSTSQAHFITV